MALPTMPSWGGPSTKNRLIKTFRVPVTLATNSGVLLSRLPRLVAVPTVVTSVAGNANARMYK